MSNKLKEQLRLKMLGQLSDEKTNLDIDNAYDVCKDFSLSFLIFFAENCFELFDSKTYYFIDSEVFQDAYTIEELFNIFIENYERNTTQ